MHIFVVSLPRAEDRRRRLLPALAPVGDVAVIDALDGRRLGLDGLATWCDRPFSARLFREMSPAEIACTVSHGLAIEAFLAGSASHALILEDDALVDAAAIRHIRNLVKAEPDLDLLKLGGSDPVTAPGRLVRVIDGTAVIAVTTFGVGAHGYALSREGARRLLASLYPITEPYDIFLRCVHRHGCRLYEAAPYPVGLDDTAARSTIGERPASLPWPGALDGARIVAAKVRHSFGRRVHNGRRFGWLAAGGRGLSRWPTAHGSGAAG